MGWFNFLTKSKKYNVTLSSVAKEFGMSQSFITELLVNAGYNTFLMPFTRLNNDHLEIILSAYVNSVKSYYRESSKNFTKFDLQKQEELRRYFKQFIHKGFFSSEFTIVINHEIQLASNGRIFNQNLDSGLIRDFFFETIDRIEFRERMRENAYYDFNEEFQILVSNIRPSFVHHELKWRLNIKHTFNDIKSRIFTITITGHYYIFTAEEDLFAAFLTSLDRCFSAVKKALGEALKFNNSNFNPQWKKIYLPL